LSVCIIFVLESEVFIRQAKFFKCQGEWDHQLNQSTGFLLIFQEDLNVLPQYHQTSSRALVNAFWLLISSMDWFHHSQSSYPQTSMTIRM
jgi:hypothetical protein